MGKQGKTIQIYLPDGNPRGIKIVDITSRTVQIFLVPRNQLDNLNNRPELAGVGVYFLVGTPEDQSQPTVYVGEAENCLSRLGQQNKTKDFWQVALICISKTEHFTKTHVKYLEWFCHQAIHKAGRFMVENATVPTCPHLSESMEADLHENFETLQVLVSTLGYPFFDELSRPDKKDLLHCKGKEAEAYGRYTDDGFVVFEGSTANFGESPASKGTWVTKIRESLVQAGTLTETGGMYRFTKNHIFSSPSAAAVAVLGRNANGWTEWKYADGKTLDEVKRKK